jgi:hypothetical protein
LDKEEEPPAPISLAERRAPKLTDWVADNYAATDYGAAVQRICHLATALEGEIYQGVGLGYRRPAFAVGEQATRAGLLPTVLLGRRELLRMAVMLDLAANEWIVSFDTQLPIEVPTEEWFDDRAEIEYPDETAFPLYLRYPPRRQGKRTNLHRFTARFMTTESIVYFAAAIMAGVVA